MAAQNEASIIAAEIERVDPMVPVLFDRDDTFYSEIEKGEVKVISNRQMRIPLELRTGGKFRGINPDGGDLGRGSAPFYDKGVISGIHMGHAMEWTKLVEWSTDDKQKAVINAFQRNLASLMPEFRRQVDSQCMTAGDGVLATISVVGNAGGVDTYTLGTDGFGARLLRFDQGYSVYNAALTTRRGGSDVTFIDYPGKQIKGAQVAGAIATDKIVVEGPTATPPVWLNGVPYHHNDASTGSWLGLDRANYPEIRANRVTANSAFALPFARLAVNKIGDRVGKDFKFSAEMWMHDCQKDVYEQMGQAVSLINKTTSDQGLNRYFGDQMQMAGAPVRTSFSWDKTRIDVIIKKLWKRAELHKPGFYTASDGRKMFEIRGASGGVAAADITYLATSWNLYLANPAAGSYISNLTVPSGY